MLSSQGYVTLIGAGGVNIRGSIVNVTTGGGRINLTAQVSLRQNTPNNAVDVSWPSSIDPPPSNQTFYFHFRRD